MYAAILHFHLHVSVKTQLLLLIYSCINLLHHILYKLYHTLVQTPVVASHSVRIEMFCARFIQFMASFVAVAHLTIVT